MSGTTIEVDEKEYQELKSKLAISIMLLETRDEEVRLSRQVLSALSIPLYESVYWDSVEVREEYLNTLVSFSKTLPQYNTMISLLEK